MADELRESFELVLAHELQHEVPVGGLEGVEHQRLRVVQAFHAERTEVGDDVGHRRGARVEHRDVDVLADAALVAVAQRRQDADHGKERGADVAERTHRVRPRALTVGARVLVDPRHRLGHRRVGRPLGVRRLDEVAGARHRHVDDFGVHGGDVVVAEAEARSRCRA